MNLDKILGNTISLKGIPRAGWKRNRVESPESVAEHSFETALIASIIADELGLAHSKLVRAALVHDLGEAVTGDIPFKNAEQLKAEQEALSKILDSAPEVKEKYLAELTTEEQAALDFADSYSMLRQAEAYGVKDIAETAKKNLGAAVEAFPALSKFWQKS